MKREILYKKIADHLALLVRRVEMRNASGFFDINFVSESFYADLLNLVYDYNLDNLNKTNKNTAAIDLGDKEKRIAVQVTSNTSRDKINETLSKYDKHKRYEEYDELIVFLLVKKPAYRGEFLHDRIEAFDIKDPYILSSYISNNISDIDKLIEIEHFLATELEDLDAKKAAAIEKFSINASSIIGEAATKIVRSHTGTGISDDFSVKAKIKDKFTSMNCIASYEKRFQQFAVYFPTIFDLIKDESVEGGGGTIQAAIAVITNLYSSILDDYDRGDKIHSAITMKLNSHGMTAEEMIGTEVLITYAVNECLIFNERK